jgi:VCBS repeat-containing protein
MNRIETAFGAAYSNGTTTFRLMSITSAGQLTNHGSWTHPANTRQYTVTSISTGDLHGRAVYIECTDGGANANGYTASLRWQLTS